MSDDNGDGSDGCDCDCEGNTCYLKMDTMAGEVNLRDDNGELEDLVEHATVLLKEAVDAYEAMEGDDDDGGFY